MMARSGASMCSVNNAGYGLIGLFEEMTEAQVRRQIDTNILGVMNVTRAVLPVMRAAEGRAASSTWPRSRGA